MPDKRWREGVAELAQKSVSLLPVAEGKEPRGAVREEKFHSGVIKLKVFKIINSNLFMLHEPVQS